MRYATSWLCCFVIDVCRASPWKTADCEDGLALVWKWIQDLSLASMLASLRKPQTVVSSCGQGRGLPRPAPLRPNLPGQTQSSSRVLPRVSHGQRKHNRGRGWHHLPGDPPLVKASTGGSNSHPLKERLEAVVLRAAAVFDVVS